MAGGGNDSVGGVLSIGNEKIEWFTLTFTMVSYKYIFS